MYKLRNLRAGLVGLGMMGRNHARILSNLEGVDLVAIADPMISLTGEIEGLEIFQTIKQIVSKNLDYCVIAAPTAQHEQISLELIAAGINILIEKPISHSYTTATRIHKTAQSAGVSGAVGHIERFNPAVQQAAEKIKDGVLGKVLQISTRRIGPFPSRIADVGVVMDLATHDIDLATWLSSSKYQDVSAQQQTGPGRNHEDLIAVTGKLENGIVVNHLVNWISPIKERKIIITGENGAFEIDTLNSDLTFFQNGKTQSKDSRIAHFRGVSEGAKYTFAFEKPEPLRTEHENFRNLILGEDSMNVSLLEGCITVKVAEAIKKSADENTQVEL